MNDWSIDQAKATFCVARWGDGYFDLNQSGGVDVRPHRDAPALDLRGLVEDIRSQGMQPPVLVRFVDILHDRVRRLCDAFADACQAQAFGGGYQAVYPIKVNQQRVVVEHILRNGGYNVGLEAGSKPELMAVLALTPAAGVIICNGYKDREYIRLALIGRRLGLRPVIVIEQPSEIELVLAEAESLGVEPLLGVRVRLATLGEGNWQNTGGERSKFGLTATDVLRIVERLRAAGHLDWLRLLHFHMGSQIARLADIRRGLQEAARFYAELHALGLALDMVDIGGGLGVDYEGSASTGYFSMNYSLAEYADTVVREMKSVCDSAGLPHPLLLSESGRALTAHHAVLITEVIDSEITPRLQPQDPGPDAALPLRALWQLLSNRDAGPRVRYDEAESRVRELLSLYSYGHVSLAERAQAEALHTALCQSLQDELREHGEDPTLLEHINQKLGAKYFCNFSVFQSLPDIWGIDQLFPILPLQRLHEAPTVPVRLQDLTCDSDGHIEGYVLAEGVSHSLPLHAPQPGESYLLGVFMVGAYQEILGDMHNLFGDTHSINVEIGRDGNYLLVDPEAGDRVDELLRYVHFDPQSLMRAYQSRINAAGLDDATRRQFLGELQDGLSGYTYFEL